MDYLKGCVSFDAHGELLVHFCELDPQGWYRYVKLRLKYGR